VANKTPAKRDVMLALLQAAESVYVNFDPRKEGVVVPPQLKRQPRVVLQYGMNMAIPIPDLDVGEEGIGATLSFDRTPTWTFVPWTAVFAIVSQDQRGMLWETDVPHEVQLEQQKRGAPDSKRNAEKPKPAPAPAATAKQAKRPALRAVDGGQRVKDEPLPKPKLKIEESEVPAGTRPVEVKREPTPPAQSDEIVEPPKHEKKKRELPPYLRVVK
jgi:stringent starvation protein B